MGTAETAQRSSPSFPPTAGVTLTSASHKEYTGLFYRKAKGEAEAKRGSLNSTWGCTPKPSGKCPERADKEREGKRITSPSACSQTQKCWLFQLLSRQPAPEQQQTLFQIGPGLPAGSPVIAPCVPHVNVSHRDACCRTGLPGAGERGWDGDRHPVRNLSVTGHCPSLLVTRGLIYGSRGLIFCQPGQAG